MTIIRDSARIIGVKHLGEAREKSATAKAAPAAPGRDEVRATLRAAFADELLAVHEEARQQGLLAAQAETKAALQARESEAEQRLAAEQARREQSLAEEVEKLQALAGTLQQQAQELKVEAQATALELAYRAVLKLLGAMSADRALLAGLVEQVVREHQISGPLTVRVAPADAERLQGVAVAGAEVVFVADAALARGDCRVAFGEGRIEAGLEHQLTRLRDIFLESLATRHEDA